MSAYFWHANLKGASFNGVDLRAVDFTRANLARADFTKTTITDSQLRSALSIRDAQLPNGTLGRDPNLLNNGYADCNTSVRNSWQVREGDIAIENFGRNKSDCRFVSLQSNVRAIMSQRVSLINNWNSDLWTESQAVLRARMTKGVKILTRGIRDNHTLIDQVFLSEMSYIHEL